MHWKLLFCIITYELSLCSTSGLWDTLMFFFSFFPSSTPVLCCSLVAQRMSVPSLEITCQSQLTATLLLFIFLTFKAQVRACFSTRTESAHLFQSIWAFTHSLISAITSLSEQKSQCTTGVDYESLCQILPPLTCPDDVKAVCVSSC